MGFYQQISKYYDYIFPVGQSQLDFIKCESGEPVKKILDVACGSGGYSIELAKLGHKLAAVDLDSEMVASAKNKALQAGVPVEVSQCDMLQLETKLQAGFDSIFCIGNSIVHLENVEQIQDVLGQMYRMLSTSGVLMLQIINYDRIIMNRVNELPAIRNSEAGLEFIRKYEYDASSGLIDFNTILTIDKDGDHQRFQNSIKLFPVMSAQMRSMLEKAGFTDISFFGDFNHTPYDSQSFMLVVKAVKH